MNRKDALENITSRDHPYDFLIIGGGATGLGAAVDAASRGYSVALLEQADFAKGTSSRSTKLVHGGVRYLRQGNVSLVFEALKERGLLYQNAPHLVHDMAFVIPTYKWWQGPFYGIGLKVYDRMAGKLGIATSRKLNKEQTLARIPTINTDDLTGGVVYHDGQFDDARLAINLAQTASEHGAHLANYCKVTALIKNNNNVTGVHATDSESNNTFPIHANCVINATGVFVDAVRRMDKPDSKPIVAVSQGIHIVLPKRFLPGKSAIMIPKTADGRVLFAVPWHDHVVVGTTDTPRPSSSLEPRALTEERTFLMDHAAKYLRNPPADNDVLSVFAGLRPLVKTTDNNDTAALSRDHTILIAHSGLITITGGKWTTYRKMAEDLIDKAEEANHLPHRPSITHNLPIHGSTKQQSSDPHLEFYGSDASAIHEQINSSPANAEQLHPQLNLRRGEIIWHAHNEMARTVEDILARRTRCLLLNASASIEIANDVATILARETNRDTTWAKQNADQFRLLARGYVWTDPASTA